MFKKIRSWIHHKDKDYCKLCGKKLNDVEKYYYESCCEKCEEKYMKKNKGVK